MTTIIFALVFVIPLIVFLSSLIWKDKGARKIGMAVLIAMVLLAVIVAYFVNRGK